MHWMELINNSKGMFTTMRKALTQNQKNRKTRGKEEAVLETNSLGCHNESAQRTAPFIHHELLHPEGLQGSLARIMPRGLGKQGWQKPKSETAQIPLSTNARSASSFPPYADTWLYTNTVSKYTVPVDITEWLQSSPLSMQTGPALGNSEFSEKHL